MKSVFTAVDQQHGEGLEAAAVSKWTWGMWDLRPAWEHEEFFLWPYCSQTPNKWDLAFVLPFRTSAITFNGTYPPRCRISWQLLAPRLVRSARIPKPSLGEKFGHLVS